MSLSDSGSIREFFGRMAGELGNESLGGASWSGTVGGPGGSGNEAESGVGRDRGGGREGVRGGNIAYGNENNGPTSEAGLYYDELTRTNLSTVLVASSDRLFEAATSADMIVKIDNEYMLVRPGSTMTIKERGLFGSAIEPHNEGAVVAEVMLVAKRDASDAVLACSQFDSDNAIDVALTFLLSTGDGTNGTYDVLPDGWGVGLPAARVDVARFEALRDSYFSGLRVTDVIDGPFDLREYLGSNLYAPLGLFPFTKLDDAFTLGHMAAPMPDQTTTALSSANIVAPPQWDAGISEVIGRVIWRADWDARSRDYKSVWIQEFVEGQERYGGTAKTLEFKSRLLRPFPQRAGMTGVSHLNTWVASDHIAARAAHLSRWQHPTPIIAVACDYSCLTVEPGDWVRVTDAVLPTATGPTRGLSSALGFVIRKRIDEVSDAPVQLTILLPELDGDNFRRISPSAKVTAWDNITKIATVEANWFSLASESLTDTSAFTAGGAGTGDVVACVTASMATVSGTVRVTAKDSTHLTLSATPATHTPAAGDFIVLADYDDQTTAAKALFASLADASSVLGSGNAAGHMMG